MTAPQRDPFIEEVRQLKQDAAKRSTTVDALAKRIREIEQAHKGKVVPAPPTPEVDAA
ncbi:MAG: hypothetical protein H6815_00835 [Phycisphaeraceae bacterium]|nr:hypothetical protein [Phycisphaerales bacterium]MCB9858970.1 hypothetical protein [Phycisphaeraceae bacterium]